MAAMEPHDLVLDRSTIAPRAAVGRVWEGTTLIAGEPLEPGALDRDFWAKMNERTHRRRALGAEVLVGCETHMPDGTVVPEERAISMELLHAEYREREAVKAERRRQRQAAFARMHAPRATPRAAAPSASIASPREPGSKRRGTDRSPPAGERPRRSDDDEEHEDHLADAGKLTCVSWCPCRAGEQRKNAATVARFLERRIEAEDAARIEAEKAAQEDTCSRCGADVAPEEMSPGRAWCRSCEAARKRRQYRARQAAA